MDMKGGGPQVIDGPESESHL
ncbi:unnamed protein product, partial [Didymodactylos carnosus]